MCILGSYIAIAWGMACLYNWFILTGRVFPVSLAGVASQSGMVSFRCFSVLVLMMLGWTRVALPCPLPYYSRWVLIFLWWDCALALVFVACNNMFGDSGPLGVSFLTVLSGSPSLYSMRVVMHPLLLLDLLVGALSYFSLTTFRAFL